MTTVYFIRHAQSDTRVRDSRTRPLTKKGLADRALVTAFLQDKSVDAVLSSPYVRAIDTVADFAEKHRLAITTIADFRERDIGSGWVPDTDFFSFVERQWADFSYALADGESLAALQARNIAALNGVLNTHKDKTLVIGTHGAALSAIIHYYDPAYDFEDFMAMVHITPWVVKMDFDGNACMSMEKIDLFQPHKPKDYSHCVVRTADLGALAAYRFVVVFARYQDQWLYCRAKNRDGYETAGGHIEPNETPLAAAKRELYEETGAERFDITPAFDYAVHTANAFANGQVFLARVDRLGPLPDYEMAAVFLCDTLPETMRFPQILPVLYEKMQAYLKQAPSDTP